MKICITLCCLRGTSQSKPFYADRREIVHINENSILENADVWKFFFKLISNFYFPPLF